MGPGIDEDDLFAAALRAHEAGEWQQAEAAYRQLLAREPDHVGALCNLAALARRFHHPGVAIELLTRVLALQPGHPGVEEQLAAARREQALADDADYADAPGQPWSASDSVWREQAGCDTLFVLFAGLGVGRSPPTFVFRRFLAGYAHIDKLFLRDLTASWYLRGLSGVSDGVEGTVAYLGQQTSGYRRTVFLGTSAGAMAAILYGELIGVDKVLAFAPTTVVGERKLTELQDHRWERRLANLRRELAGSRYLDLANLNPLRVPVDIYFPASSALDQAHAGRVTGAAVRHLPQPGDSHLIALQMRDSGLLRLVIERELLPPGA